MDAYSQMKEMLAMRYQIGDFSRISRLSIKTLRYYHEYGLLEPEKVDGDTGYRYYDERSLERVRVIQGLKNMDFTLKNIREMLDKYTDDAEVLEFMQQKSREVREKLAYYSRIQKELEVFISSARQGEMNQTRRKAGPELQEIPDLLVAACRFKGRYQDISSVLRKIFRACGSCVSAPFTIYYDGEYREEDADLEICVPVKNKVTAEGISTRLLKGGKAITLVHRGAYEELGSSYKMIIDEIQKRSMRVQTPYREVYLKGPGIIMPRSPKGFLTEIQVLLEEQESQK